MKEDKFTDSSIEIRMTTKQLEKIYKFSRQEFEDIKKRFNEFSDKNGEINLESFKRSMGLLGFGEAEFLSVRIFHLITPEQSFNLIDFIKFLSSILHGSELEKARLSFKFIDKRNRNRITYEDIASIACEVSFLWNYLTGEKAIADSDYIMHICEKLGITEQHSYLSFEDYLEGFEKEFFNWFDFFNNTLKKEPHLPTLVRKEPFSMRQLEETLKVFSSEVYDMIVELNNKRDFLQFHPEYIGSYVHEVKTLKGPLYLDCHTTPLRGDNGDLSDSYGNVQNFESLVDELQKNSVSSESVLIGVANRLDQLYELGMKTLSSSNVHPHKYPLPAEDVQSYRMHHRRTTIINKSKPSTRRSNYVYFGHYNWNLIINMMLGIRRSVKWHYSLKAGPGQYPPQLTAKYLEEEYQNRYTYYLIDKRDDKYDKEFCYTFVDYAPKIFHDIRRLWGITTYAYLKSIGPENLIGSLVLGRLCTLTEQVSAGKSGSFIYYTEDSKYLIKTICKEYYQLFKATLKNYHQFLMENPETFIVRIYGLHKLKKVNSSKRYYLVVMNNFFSSPLQIDLRYDLKGSTYHRKSRDEKWDRSIALKDLDLIESRKQGQHFNLSSTDKMKVLNQIKKDVHFFSFNNIIDYSLLVGVHNLQRYDFLLDYDQKDPSVRGFLSPKHNEIYFFGLIDIFTGYTTKKMFESTFMNMVTKGASSLPPLDYEKRFIDFVYTYVFNN